MQNEVIISASSRLTLCLPFPMHGTREDKSTLWNTFPAFSNNSLLLEFLLPSCNYIKFLCSPSLRRLNNLFIPAANTSEVSSYLLPHTFCLRTPKHSYFILPALWPPGTPRLESELTRQPERSGQPSKLGTL